MATHKQTEANRRNAQRSTGPRTPEGKARSARTPSRPLSQPAIACIHLLRLTTQRAFDETLAQLRAARAVRPDDLEIPQPVEKEAPAPEIGFVPGDASEPTNHPPGPVV